ncbi:hypothetical protein EVC62_06730 [Salinicola endophyticus]|uniref:Uncharacterized protein n=1 Tax=Salinicola endophyticus TaxID=1949083 RepID=A0ABY8FGM9_9GAMM|nr:MULTISPECIES: hypothetical protein [Salinicola]WFF41220.1 hypothetical protein EVC62_06730 [Salinicola endophyticus]
MDWLTFISSLVRSLAWPVFALILALLFRDQILQFGSFIKKLRAGPIEAEFEHDLEQLRSLSPGRDDVVGVRAGEEETFLTELAERHPRTAILEAWTRLERAARASLSSRESEDSSPGEVSAARLPELLVQAGLIDQPQVTLYHELRRLRREVARDLEPTKEAAQNYVELCRALQFQIDHGA